jgi:hypothetical protein
MTRSSHSQPDGSTALVEMNRISDGGLLASRELDDALGLTDTAITKLLDGRRGKNTRHKLSGLLRQAVFGRLAGYEDVNDAERLARDFLDFRVRAGAPEPLGLVAMDRMLQAIRKDLGLSNRRLQQGDFIKLFVNDPAEVDKILGR